MTWVTSKLMWWKFLQVFEVYLVFFLFISTTACRNKEVGLRHGFISRFSSEFLLEEGEYIFYSSLDYVFGLCKWIRDFCRGKISAQPHPTLCIRFLDRENNDKNNTLPLGKQICFTIVWGCAEILPLSPAYELMYLRSNRPPSRYHAIFFFRLFENSGEK